MAPNREAGYSCNQEGAKDGADDDTGSVAMGEVGVMSGSNG